jgi:hypothetical protein
LRPYLVIEIDSLQPTLLAFNSASIAGRYWEVQGYVLEVPLAAWAISHLASLTVSPRALLLVIAKDVPVCPVSAKSPKS